MSDDSPVRLLFHQSPLNNSGFLRDATKPLMNSWTRSIRDVGGYWIGQAYWNGPTEEMLDVFQTGLGWEIRETAGAMQTWEGFLAKMDLTYRGQKYTRDWTQLTNRVKVIYSKIGQNQLTNNSVESTVWGAYGSPPTRERVSTWRTDGDYGCHVIANAANQGVVIQSAITIAANKGYQAHVTVKIVSGTWRLELYDSGGNILDFAEQDTAGKYVMTCVVWEDNTIAGDIGMRLYCTTSSGEIYADAAVFQLSPNRAETNWFADSQSIAEYGTIETIISQAGMTDAAAEALATRTLYQKRWGRVLPPENIELGVREGEDSLKLTFLGYAFTLLNRYTALIGTDNACSTIVANLLANEQFVRAGLVSTNALSFHVDDRDAYRVWDLMRDIAKAGDASGNRWTLGVYNDRRLYYEQGSSSYTARVRNGQILDGAGGPLSGWMARPGLIALDDLPIPYDFPGGTEEDRQKSAWLNEVEFDLGEYLKSGRGIVFRKVLL